jgi:hypothetical protein
VFSLVFALGILITGCGVTEKKVQESEARINALAEKGVHDTILTEPRVLLTQVKACKMSGNSRDLKKYNDSMLVLLDKAEAWYNGKMTEFKPQVDALHKALTEKKAGLTGLHLKFADSIFADIDSYISKKWLLQANVQLKKFEELFPKLLEDEAHAKKIRPKVTGTWTSTETPMSKALNAVWKRRYTFNKDGTIKTHEKKKGKSQVDLIEDWEFFSAPGRPIQPFRWWTARKNG